MSEMQSLTQSEVLAVLKLAASESKRNHAMILLAFKHGLRASEVCALRLNDIDLKNGIITIRRIKGSLRSSQQLLDVPGQPLLSEKRVLKAWLEERETYHDSSDYLFLSQKGGCLDRSAFYRVFADIAERIGLPKDKRHPHVLKHSLGFSLIEQGVDDLVIPAKVMMRFVLLVCRMPQAYQSTTNHTNFHALLSPSRLYTSFSTIWVITDPPVVDGIDIGALPVRVVFRNADQHGDNGHLRFNHQGPPAYLSQNPIPKPSEQFNRTGFCTRTEADHIATNARTELTHGAKGLSWEY